MKTLKTEFEASGFHHRQLFRTGDVAIYERWKAQQRPHYEVVKIGSHNGYELAGNHIEAAETYPSAEQFGSRAWTYNDKQAALRRFNELARNQVAK